MSILKQTPTQKLKAEITKLRQQLFEVCNNPESDESKSIIIHFKMMKAYAKNHVPIIDYLKEIGFGGSEKSFSHYEAPKSIEERPTYEKWLKSIKPPFKCVYDNNDWVATDKSVAEWTLTPCYKTTNNGENLKVPIDTILTHIYMYTEQLSDFATPELDKHFEEKEDGK